MKLPLPMPPNSGPMSEEQVDAYLQWMRDFSVALDSHFPKETPQQRAKRELGFTIEGTEL